MVHDDATVFCENATRALGNRLAADTRMIFILFLPIVSYSPTQDSYAREGDVTQTQQTRQHFFGGLLIHGCSKSIKK